MTPSRQPWLHDLVTTLQAPTVALCSPDGQVRSNGAQGVFHADVRVLSQAVLIVDGAQPQPVAGGNDEASTARFTGLIRTLGDPGADPTVRVERVRRVAAGSVAEEISLLSYASRAVRTMAELHLAADLAEIEAVKSGRADDAPRSGVAITVEQQSPDSVLLSWRGEGATVRLHAQAPAVTATPDPDSGVTLRWPVDLPAAGTSTLRWELTAEVTGSPVTGAPSAATAWRDVRVTAGDHRLTALAAQSLADLRALLMTPAHAPDDVFAAAGAPWFFTLFGRDSIWAARLMLPFGWELAAGTLRALASRQGTRMCAQTMEEPGKIPHELRRAESVHGETDSAGDRAMVLPPLYYGTVDATPLWVCLLHDAWRAGMPEEQVRALLPNLRAALDWIVEHGDADGDGFLEYLDAGGRGLANQGWKDSGDSIRYADGRQAQGPVALCEVQGYAYEAAVHGADLLDAFGPGGAARLRAWAADLAVRFRESFWASDAAGPFPVLALDGEKKPVDSLTSNIGHLLGTGLLNAAESALVLDRLTGPGLDGGFGLRTMSAANGGYSPLSYHCGSVWPHDTAIVIRAMASAGHGARALGLIEGLLAAGSRFSWRLPELYSGDARTSSPWPVPYPAACRPQAWAAAAIGPIVQALLGLEVNVPAGRVKVDPLDDTPFGALHVDGLVAGPRRFSTDAPHEARVSES
ncbi:glycogen debranching N-terminal domain-containing protein [Actinocrinis sp.]|uniref:amylo-alpha-1,6-glucosidase n=1 Tax=Actinocrinis sp. TaxID=1920516 RepID=UPI002D5FE6D8|nr:glycogen debranching N-terminal domain-containing protein [Actinocrinis sp.]HZP51020.1 glycogen debranching N-terminal domain-containing protein [Actinocrinis sp.]